MRVLIFTSEGDYTSKEVLEWLNFNDVSFVRLNKEYDKIDILNIRLNQDCHASTLLIGDEIVNLEQVYSVWFRGGVVRLANFFHNIAAIEERKSFKDSLEYFLSAYSVAKLEFLVNSLKTKRQIGENLQGRFNKIIALQIASKVGFMTPDSIITTNKKDLIDFYFNKKEIITKSLDINFNYYDTDNNKRLHGYTYALDQNDIEIFPETFPLTLFQEKVEKKYEIRVVYLNNKCHSAAIFSQINSKTKVDYRRYDYKKMNRILPYILPSNIENKVHEFMKESGLNTGSIDIIRSIDDKFIFLEVNPIGQFGYISQMCNYYLEKVIADFLAK